MIKGRIEETVDPRKQHNVEVDELLDNSNDVVSKSGKRFREEKLMDNISKIVKKILPPSVAMEREVGEILVECVKSFISAVSCEGGSNSLHENREAVNGRDILIALGQMGWEDFHQPLSIYYQKLQSQRLVEANKPFTPNPEMATQRNRSLYEEAVSGLYCRNISGANLQFSAKKKVAATTKKAKYDGVFNGKETRNDAAFQYLSIQNLSQQSLQRDAKSSSMNKPLSNAHAANFASSSGSNSIGQRTAENSSRSMTSFKPTHNIAYSSSSIPNNNNQYMNFNSSINSNSLNVMPSDSIIREGAMPYRSSNDHQRNQGISSHGGMFLQPPPPPMLLSSSNLSTRDLLALQSVVAATSQVQLSQHMSIQQQFDSMNQAFRQPFAPSSTSSSSSSTPSNRNAVAYPNTLYQSHQNQSTSSSNGAAPVRNGNTKGVDQMSKPLPPKVLSNGRSLERFTTYREALVDHLENVLVNNRQRSPFIALGAHPIPTLKERYSRSGIVFIIMHTIFFLRIYFTRIPCI